MTLADTGLWVALLAMIGREPLSVTSHLDIDFLRKPAAADVIAHTTLHKIGKRLAVGDVLMYSAGEQVPCARASVTYAIPSVRLDPPASGLTATTPSPPIPPPSTSTSSTRSSRASRTGPPAVPERAAGTVNEISTCFTLVHEPSGAQVGFARVVTDDVSFGWVADVFVLTAPGRGLGIFLVQCVVEAYGHLPRLVLATRDAHGVYAKVGFGPLSRVERWMERWNRPPSP